jgi:hypothetical protein
MATHAFALEGVTFYASFDHWLRPDLAVGSRAPIKTVGRPSLAPGKIGKALRLDGSSYLEFPAGPNVGERGGTVALWFKPDNWGAKIYDNIAGFSDSPDNALHFERAHPGGQFRLVYGGPNVKTQPRDRSIFSKEALRSGEWVHLAATWDHQAQRAEMFVNGQSAAVLTGAGPLPLKPPSILIGCGFGRLSRAVQGLIDEVVMLDHAAKAEEVAKLMEGLQAGGHVTEMNNAALSAVVDRDRGQITIGGAGEGGAQVVLGPAHCEVQIGDRKIVPPRWAQETTAEAIAPRLGAADHRVFEARDEATGALVRLHVQLQQAQPLALLWVEVANPTAQTLVVQHVNVLRTVDAGAVMFGAAPEHLRIFLDNGSLCGSGSHALIGKDAHHVAHGALVVADPEGDTATSCSFATFQTATVSNHVLNGSDGLPQTLEARCDYPNGYRIAAEGTLRSEVLAIGTYGGTAAGRMPALLQPTAGHAALAAWADAVMAIADLQPPRFCPSGWNSWYCYRLTITEDLVLANARVIKEKLPGLGLENMQIDHGWQYKDIVGNWVVNDRFPHGLPWLSDQLKQMGCTLGLWTGVTQVSEFAPLFTEHPEALFHNADGTPMVCSDYWYWEPHGKTYFLDPTHPVGEEFYRKAGEAIRSYGCAYWKNDFQANLLNAGAVLHDKETTYGVPVYLKAVRAYRAGAGPNVAHMACNAALNPIAGLCDAAWTHADLGNPGGRWDWLRSFWHDFCSRAHVSGKFYWSDPDYLQVGQGDAHENRVRMAFMVFGGGPVFLSDRLPELTDDQIELIKQCLPAPGGIATPLDLFTYREYPQVMHLPVKRDWGAWHLLGLFNLDEQPGKVTVNLGELGLEDGREYVIFDYFQRQLVGRVRACAGDRRTYAGPEVSLRYALPATEVAVLRLTPVEARPFIVGTDLHLAQGAVELQQVRWDDKTLTLSGEATRPPGTKGHLYVHVPEGYMVKEGPAVAPDRVVALPLRFEAPSCRWSLRFRRD